MVASRLYARISLRELKGTLPPSFNHFLCGMATDGNLFKRIERIADWSWLDIWAYIMNLFKRIERKRYNAPLVSMLNAGNLFKRIESYPNIIAVEEVDE